MPLSQPIISSITNNYVSGGTITQATGPADAAQNIVTVDDTTGFLAGTRISYVLVGGVLEYNVIDTVDTGTQLTLITPIGTGGIANNTFIELISEGEYQAAIAIEYGNSVVPTLSTTMEWAGRGVFSVRAYGATGDGTTDDTVAIQAAIDAAAVSGAPAQKGGMVVLPYGDYRISATIVVKSKVMVVGTGYGGALIRASDTFDFDTYPAMITLGPDATGSAVTTAGAFLDNVNIDCNWRPRSIGVRTDGANEGCGLRRCRIRFWTSMAIQVNEYSAYRNAKNFLIQDVDLTASGGDPAQGAGLYAGSIRTYSLSLTNITGTGSVVTVTAAGHLMKKADCISISGTTSYNGTYIIGTVPTADTFTFNASGTGAEGSGTITQEAVGIMLTGAGGGMLRIDKATVTTAARIWGVAGKYMHAGIMLNDTAACTLSMLHLENSEAGLSLGERLACKNTQVYGATSGSGGTESTIDLVRINGANQNTVLFGITKANATNGITNTRTGQTLTDDHIGAYIASNISTDFVHNPDGTSYRTDASTTPVGNKTPTRVGDIFLSSATGLYWISGGLTQSDWKPLSHRKKDFVQVRREAAQTISNATFQTVAWDTLKGETDTVMWTDTSGTNPERVRPVAGARWYKITAYVEWAANGTGERKVRLMRELGGTGDVSWVTTPASTGGSQTGQHLTYYFTQVGSGAYFFLSVLQSSGGDLDIVDAFFQIEEVYLD